MRILCNYQLKCGRENYGSECYNVSLEATSEFNNVSEVADFLFQQARAAVERQASGTATNNTPVTTIPAEPIAQAAAPEKSDSPTPAAPKAQDKASGNGGSSNGNGNGNSLPCTEKQSQMVKRLLKENFRTGNEATGWLKQAGFEDTKGMTRKTASRLIEQLMDRKRSA